MAKETTAYNSKEMLKEHGAKGTKFSYRDRKTIERTVDTKHHKAGKVYSTFALKADALIKAGLAKEVK